MTALIDVEYFKLLPLGVNEKAMPANEALAEFIETASEQVEIFCDRHFLSAQRIEKIRGTDQQSLMVDEWPVTALASLSWTDDLGLTDTIATNLVNFTAAGVLTFIDQRNGPWLKSRVYTVTYTSGYSTQTMPRPVKHAVALWATDLMRPSFGGPSKQMPPEFIPFTESQITELLDGFRRRRMG